MAEGVAFVPELPELDYVDVETDEETVIRKINGHRWYGKALKFEVIWEDDDITWEALANVNNCSALDIYLQHHALSDPLKLSKKVYHINVI